LEAYVCVTVQSRPNEPADGFNKRLIDFWTGMIRKWPEQYKQVYGETTRFAPDGDRLCRQYMIEGGIAELLGTELTAAGIDHDPIDDDDVYSKYEATPPEWFQIPH